MHFVVESAVGKIRKKPKNFKNRPNMGMKAVLA
jgi:hypothetical protein